MPDNTARGATAAEECLCEAARHGRLAQACEAPERAREHDRDAERLEADARWMRAHDPCRPSPSGEDPVDASPDSGPDAPVDPIPEPWGPAR